MPAYICAFSITTWGLSDAKNIINWYIDIRTLSGIFFALFAPDVMEFYFTHAMQWSLKTFK